MTDLLKDVRSDDWTAAGEPPTTAVLLLHGYGSNERDLSNLAPALGLALPWASLRAPIEVRGGGATWFQIITPGDPAAEPVAASTQAIWAWVDEHLDPQTRVLPIGFSQGGLMVSQLLRTRPERVVAPVILSGFVAAAAQPGDEALAAARPAVFWGRGSADRVITEAAISRTSNYLPLHSTLDERVYAGLAHSISAAELSDVGGFIGAHVGADVM
jgi:phospholipase/carboxylesterase